jgi:hypothetical protein
MFVNKMNSIISGSVKMALTIVVVMVIAVATANTILKVGFMNVSQAQEEQQQEQSSSPVPPSGPSLPSASLPLSSTSSADSDTIAISPELKAKMCDPNNPKLNFVNGTESRVCGLPKSIKNETVPTTTLPTQSTPILPSSPGQ